MLLARAGRGTAARAVGRGGAARGGSDGVLCFSFVFCFFFLAPQICDFGLARVEESDEARHMTQEVVTQYYRAPEILMGSRHYSNSIDIWSVGCIFAELLGRRILFQAQSPIQQVGPSHHVPGRQ